MKFSITTAELCEQLRCSESTVLRLRKAGILKPGVHFVAAGTGISRPAVRWNPEACQDALAMRARRMLSA